MEEDLMIGLREQGVESGDELLKIVIDEFPTHIAKTKNKIKANKFIKINGQHIYNGALNRFARAIAIENLHDYINDKLKGYPSLEGKFRIYLEVFTVINHGDIKRKMDGSISWKKAKEGYEPTWDIDNLAYIWIKNINDCLQASNIIPNDHVGYVKGGGYDFVEVDNFEQRKLVITITRAK